MPAGQCRCQANAMPAKPALLNRCHASAQAKPCQACQPCRPCQCHGKLAMPNQAAMLISQRKCLAKAMLCQPSQPSPAMPASLCPRQAFALPCLAVDANANANANAKPLLCHAWQSINAEAKPKPCHARQASHANPLASQSQYC